MVFTYWLTSHDRLSMCSSVSLNWVFSTKGAELMLAISMQSSNLFSIKLVYLPEQKAAAWIREVSCQVAEMGWQILNFYWMCTHGRECKPLFDAYSSLADKWIFEWSGIISTHFLWVSSLYIALSNMYIYIDGNLHE